MNEKIWHYGLQLESTTLVKRLFKKIHNRDLNTTRAKQIVAAYLQGKEYYRNADHSNISVKPLLLFYGASSLSRCLTLLLQVSGGEEALTKGHGLTSEGWIEILGTNVEESLKNIGNLKVSTTNGLFTDLLQATKNISYFHVRSSGVDWSIPYSMPELPASTTFLDIVSRIPDIGTEYTLWSEKQPLTLSIHNMSFNDKKFTINVRPSDNLDEVLDYAEGKIEVSNDGALKKLVGTEEHFPMLINSFLNKSFGEIPNFYMSKPLNGFGEIAQIPLTFLLSYYLGMLCRYFPSHWMALSRGNIGDEIWPLMQTSMNCIQFTYPELIMEYIQETSKKEET